MKLKDAPVLMDSTSTITEFVKKFQLFQSLAMLGSFLKVQKDVLPVQLDADHAQARRFVLLVLKMDSLSWMDHAEQFVEMDWLLELSNAMTETVLETTDVQLHVQLNHCGLVLVNHLFVLTTALLFVEMEESKEEKNVMMGILWMEMDAATDVKENRLQVMEVLQVARLQSLKDWLWWATWTQISTTYLLFWRRRKLTHLQMRTRWRIS
jgi:hypothetical protein